LHHGVIISAVGHVAAVLMAVLSPGANHSIRGPEALAVDIISPRGSAFGPIATDSDPKSSPTPKEPARTPFDLAQDGRRRRPAIGAIRRKPAVQQGSPGPGAAKREPAAYPLQLRQGTVKPQSGAPEAEQRSPHRRHHAP